MKRIVTSLALLALGAVSAAAADDVIAQRKALMKANGEATKAAVAMLKGQSPFDLKAVQDGLKNFGDAAGKMPGLYPPDSKTGGETQALPAVWDNKADFDARMKKFGADAAAAATAITDEASFKTNFPGVLKNCSDCHETYRLKK